MSNKPRDPEQQLGLLLARAAVDAVIDVGANRGQYAQRLRRAGFAGPILSFEPQPEVHAALLRAAADDPAWTVAPPLALGRRAEIASLHLAREDDMTSLRPQGELLVRLSPSSAVRCTLPVGVDRLDAVLGDRPWQRLLVKIDVQGSEDAVLDGIGAAWPRVVAVQLELALSVLYEGERHYLETCARLESLGYGLALVIPGYFDGKLGRQLQFDGVFLRAD